MELRHTGTEPHFLVLDRYIGSGTIDNEVFAALLESEMTGVEPPLDFDPGRYLQPVTHTLTQSAGTTTWIAVSMEAGTCLAACFFPTAETGAPHAVMGMHQVFEVTD